MDATKVFSDLVAAYKNPDIRVIVLRGGTRSGKTWAVLMLLIFILTRTKRKRTVSVISESMPHLKKGAIKDFKDILDADGIYDENRWHDGDKQYKYPFNSILEFFSAQDKGKVTGPARTILYLNEAINIGYEIYRQAAIRTTEKIIIDFNPAHDFWVDEFIIPREDVIVIDSTYLDNDMLTAAQIAEIEANRDIDPDWWAVYGLGQKGTREGLVMQNWDIVEKMPAHHKEEYGGIDFGYTAPTSINHLKLTEGEVYIDEIAYSPGMDNTDIANAIKAAGLQRLKWICDNAEPKSIAELKALGINAVGADTKNIPLGVQIMNRYKKHITARSVNIIFEYRRYRYPKDEDTGKYGTHPIKKFCHAIDGQRYVFLTELSAVLPPKFSISFSRNLKT